MACEDLGGVCVRRMLYTPEQDSVQAEGFVS